MNESRESQRPSQRSALDAAWDELAAIIDSDPDVPVLEARSTAPRAAIDPLAGPRAPEPTPRPLSPQDLPPRLVTTRPQPGAPLVGVVTGPERSQTQRGLPLIQPPPRPPPQPPRAARPPRGTLPLETMVAAPRPGEASPAAPPSGRSTLPLSTVAPAQARPPVMVAPLPPRGPAPGPARPPVAATTAPPARSPVAAVDLTPLPPARSFLSPPPGAELAPLAAVAMPAPAAAGAPLPSAPAATALLAPAPAFAATARLAELAELPVEAPQAPPGSAAASLPQAQTAPLAELAELPVEAPPASPPGLDLAAAPGALAADLAPLPRGTAELPRLALRAGAEGLGPSRWRRPLLIAGGLLVAAALVTGVLRRDLWPRPPLGTPAAPLATAGPPQATAAPAAPSQPAAPSPTPPPAAAPPVAPVAPAQAAAPSQAAPSQAAAPGEVASPQPAQAAAPSQAAPAEADPAGPTPAPPPVAPPQRSSPAQQAAARRQLATCQGAAAERVLAVLGDTPKTRRGLGDCAAARRPAEAELHYRAALAQDPQDRLSILGLARALQARGELAQALPLFRQYALRAPPRGARKARAIVTALERRLAAQRGAPVQ